MQDFEAVTGSHATNQPSSEFSGVVTAVSDDVADFAVGDRVFCLWPGRFENIVRVPARMCQLMRPEDSFEMAATLPLAYCTAWTAVVEAAHTEANERILIQSATGGVGMAAIAVARSIGAEIYATAGDASKREALCDMGIPEDHIFSSRDPAVAAAMKKQTEGRGFDVVLNVSSGDYLHTVSWPLVAPFGRFVELRRSPDMASYDGVGSPNKSAEGVSILPVDILRLCRQKPAAVARAMSAIGTRYRDGDLAALPHKVFPVSRLGQAYTEFSRFEHTGKLVLGYSDDDQLPYFPTVEPPTFREDGAYLVVGPLRDITTQLVRWMIRNGAQRLVFLEPGSPQGRESITPFHDELVAAGISATFLTGTATNIDHVRRAMTAFAPYAIRGVFHTAGLRVSPEVGSKSDIIETHSEELAAEEIHGLANIQTVVLETDRDLDDFVVLTAAEPLSRTLETGYDLAANALYWSRREQGLPCTRIHLGAAAPTHRMLELLSTSLSRSYVPDASPMEGPIYILNDAAAPQQDEDESGGASAGASCGQQDASWAVYTNHQNTLKRRAAAANIKASEATVRAQGGNVKELIADRLSKLLWIPRERLRIDMSLSSMGIDSMIASEFRSWVQQTFHASVGMLELLAQQTTVEKLEQLVSGS